MKRLSNKHIQQLCDEMRTACQGGPQTAYPWFDKNDTTPATLEFPGGELMNEGIKGFLWAWKMKGMIEPTQIEKGDRFNANGLEGKISIHTTLPVALLAWAELPQHRRQIRA